MGGTVQVEYVAAPRLMCFVLLVAGLGGRHLAGDAVLAVRQLGAVVAVERLLAHLRQRRGGADARVPAEEPGSQGARRQAAAQVSQCGSSARGPSPQIQTYTIFFSHFLLFYDFS